MSCDYSAKVTPCIGSGGGRDTTKLLKTNLCQPVRQPCDEVLRTVFFSGPLPIINGLFTVNNTSLTCTMTVEVTDANGAAVPYTVLPQSSIAVAVESVTLIEISCTGPAGPDPTMFCSGSFEANLNYCADC